MTERNPKPSLTSNAKNIMDFTSRNTNFTPKPAVNASNSTVSKRTTQGMTCFMQISLCKTNSDSKRIDRVRLVAGRPGFNPWPSHTKRLKVEIHSFPT